MPSIENQRLTEAREQKVAWKKWGPYLSERQWGTVREDYSDNSDAWGYFSHDQSRSRVYRWGEDGLGGISDDKQRLCFALALWNGQDPIIKERLFGLTNGEGNHGEDVKEYYFYLDSTPTHTWMKYLYKYPQLAFPYDDLVQTNAGRNRLEPEYELLDTGVFDDNRYFDVFVEYAKGGEDDLCIQIRVVNRSPVEAPLHVLPSLWFRNYWEPEERPMPEISLVSNDRVSIVKADDRDPKQAFGPYYLYLENADEVLFTNNETNRERIFGQANTTPYVKDAFNNYLVHDSKSAVNPEHIGTKSAGHYHWTLAPGEEKSLRLRLSVRGPEEMPKPFLDFDDIVKQRLQEADEFYDGITPDVIRKEADQVMVMRQALAGMLWTKQFYNYDVGRWLKEKGYNPFLAHNDEKHIRNQDWYHMVTEDIISMPDKWEYPWFAAWDLAFHMFPLRMVDRDFAKHQLDLMLRADYLHPNGQMPAYEWHFSDVNPPVHAWATMQTYLSDKVQNGGKGDLDFLRFSFGKLLVNFTWWMNRKDAGGSQVFEGGFLGLDNIGVFDRSAPLPTGGFLQQADGTAWMGFFSLQMLRMAFELAQKDRYYESYIYKFYTHTVTIAAAMDKIGEREEEMWDEADGFFYDVLCFPDGNATRLKVRSMVGLLPLMITSVFPQGILKTFPELSYRIRQFHERYPELSLNIHPVEQSGLGRRRMISIVNEKKLKQMLRYMLDEKEFLSPYGIRALSKYHKDHPYIFHWDNQEYRVDYVAGDSESAMFGGNSNWRGPVWIPVNFLLIQSIVTYYSFYGEGFKVECPTGSGNFMTLLEVAKFLSQRLVNTFARDENGKRAAHGRFEKFQDDPHWRDLILFYEYFHGDDGSGLGASHQTGWTGCIAELIQELAVLSPEDFSKPLHLAGGLIAADVEDEDD
ncbi:MAG: glucosidase [Bacteroidota bacterium]